MSGGHPLCEQCPGTRSVGARLTGALPACLHPYQPAGRGSDTLPWLFPGERRLHSLPLLCRPQQPWLVLQMKVSSVGTADGP